MQNSRDPVSPRVGVQCFTAVAEAIPITERPVSFRAVIVAEDRTRCEDGRWRGSFEFGGQLGPVGPDAKQEGRHRFLVASDHERLQDNTVRLAYVPGV